jgi:hypothetical protein
MTPKSRGAALKRMRLDEYVREALVLLVRLCGIDAVRDALSEIERPHDPSDTALQGKGREATGGPTPNAPRSWVPRAIVPLEQAEPQKFEMLKSFFTMVESGDLLPEAEDVRRFAENLGLKELRGSKRRELISKLGDPMSALSIERIQQLVGQAKGISANERRKGYSILTDKLLEGVRK